MTLVCVLYTSNAIGTIFWKSIIYKLGKKMQSYSIFIHNHNKV